MKLQVPVRDDKLFASLMKHEVNRSRGPYHEYIYISKAGFNRLGIFFYVFTILGALIG